MSIFSDEIISYVIFVFPESITAACVGVTLPVVVTRFSKWKTGIQMLAIALLLLYFASKDSTVYAFAITSLWLAAILTAITGYRYMRKGFKYIEFSPEK